MPPVGVAYHSALTHERGAANHQNRIFQSLAGGRRADGMGSVLTRLRAQTGRLVESPRLTWCIRLSAAAALFVAAALATLPPIGGDKFHYGHIDNLQVIYLLEWARYALFTEPHRFFEGLMAYGMGDSLFFSHLLLGGLPIYVPVAALFGPGVGLNVLTIASPILNAAAATAAAWILLGRWWPAVVAGFIFAFAPIQQEFFQFHTLFMIWWTPLAMMFWFWFVQRPAWWKVSAAWLCVFIQLATGIYGGFIAFVTLTTLIAAALLSGRLRGLDRQLCLKAAAGTLAAALPFIPLLMGYVGFWLDNQEVRSLNEARLQSAHLPQYLPQVTRSQRWFQAVASNFHGTEPVFPAIGPAVLAALGLIAGIARRPRAIAIALGAMGLLMFVLSLGPELWWNHELTGWSLPYAAAHALIPGFAAMRFTALFATGMVLAMAFLAAIAVDRFYCWRRIAGWKAPLTAVVLLGILAVEFARIPVSVVDLPRDQDLEAALAHVPEGPIAFIPVSGDQNVTLDAAVHRTWSTLNGGRQPVLDGTPGFESRGASYLARLVNGATRDTRDEILNALIAFGVRTVVLDRKHLSDDQVAAWQATIRSLQPTAQGHETEQVVVSHLGPDVVASADAWADVAVQPVVLRTSPPESNILVPVTVQNLTDRPWRPPPGRRARAGELVWDPADGSESIRQSITLRVPPIVPAGATAQALEQLATRTPASPGRYRLRLSVEETQLAAVDVEILARSAYGPRPLQAADLDVLALPTCIRAGQLAFVQVQALNSGETTWGPTHRLGVRWSLPDDRFIVDDLPTLESRLLVPHNEQKYSWPKIETGSGFVFEGTIRVPVSPGPYTLTLGMVEEDVAWFGEIDVPVVVVSVDDDAPC